MATPTTLPATFVSGAVLTAAQMNDLRGAFRVLQVVSTTKSDTFSTSSTSFTDVTGLSVSITPSSSSSLVLVLASATMGVQNFLNSLALVRDSTQIFLGDAASNRVRAWAVTNSGNTNDYNNFAAVFLDNPATTSATTYKIQMRVSSGTGYLNRTVTDLDNNTYARTASNITVMEVSA
jgi:hypothetical protein